MKKNLTPVQESILILCTLQALLDEYRKILIKEKKNHDPIIFSMLQSQVILTSCSYMDEWELLGKLVPQEPKILKLRKLVSPAVERIYKWKDMKQFRNSIIAHNHRNKKANNSPAILRMKRNLNCPNSYYDFKLLFGCIYLTKNVLLRIFSEEYNQILPNLKNISSIKPINEIKDKETYLKEFNKITQNIQSLIEVLN